MIREIVKDKFILSQKSQLATLEDVWIENDLRDTLKENHEHCVGMAANMIGELKRIIIFQDGKEYVIMYNPIVIKQSDSYHCEEGCLSHLGTRPTKRYKHIKVEFQDQQMRKRIKTYSDFTAQIIQHEIDHCDGILI